MRQLTFKTRSAWRTWLRQHHRTATEAWVVLFKKHSGRGGVTYEAAVEEALCFGWIDGQLRRINDVKHMLRFSPRRSNSVWAPSNIKRVRRLIKAGRMTPAGLALFRAASRPARTVPTVTTLTRASKRMVVPADLRRALAGRPTARQHFLGYPPSFRLLAVHWVTSAKKRETRQRRIELVVRNAAKHSRPTF